MSICPWFWYSWLLRGGRCDVKLLRVDEWGTRASRWFRQLAKGLVVLKGTV